MCSFWSLGAPFQRRERPPRNAPWFALICSTPTDTRRARQNAIERVLGGTRASLPTFCRLGMYKQVRQAPPHYTEKKGPFWRGVSAKINNLFTDFRYPLTYMKKIGVLEGCFGRWFTVSLQKQKSPHLIGQKSGKIPPSRWKVYILFTEINTPHLIGQKIAVLKGVPLKIYNLFTDQGHSLLNSHGNCKK